MSTRIISTPLGRCRAGLGSVDITPPPGAYHRNWGAALHDAAEGIHRPLRATALLLQDLGGGPEHCLVALDLGWMNGPEMEAVLEEVSAGTGVARERLVLALSHTHAAINLDLSREGEPGGEHIRPYLRALPERIVRAVRAAREQMQSVEVAYARGRCSLAWQRDFWDDERGIFACGTNPDADPDDAVLVLRFSDLEGRGLAHLVNYACHPTSLAWRNRLISPDYVGALRELVEKETGVPCLFAQGAAGDLGPKEGFSGDPAVADRNGRQLGYAALEAIQTLPPVGTQMQYGGPLISGATLAIWEHVPVPPERMERVASLCSVCFTVDLPVRRMPSQEELEARLAQWREKEEQARREGDEVQVRDCRAQVERVRRWMRRRESMAGRKEVAYPVRIWRIGEGVLVMVGGEPYSRLQQDLRARFPRTPIGVIELCNQGFSYILPADQYGKGLYQDECAVVGPGSLEKIAGSVARRLEAWGME